MGLAFAWAVYTPRTFAASQLQLLVQAEADTKICPLSEKQQENSIQKFTEMMPTFTHPRCINCHGAMNPFAANTNHIGGRIGLKFKEIIEHDDILGKEIKLVVPDVENADVFANRCQDCHSAFTGSRGWGIPPVQVYFVGKDSVQLCKQMKREFGGELQQFLDHLDHDELGFIQEAFRGTRGLDDNGQATYLNETGRDLLPVPENEKPPISHEAFVSQGKAWLEAIGYHGEGTKGGLTCGCEPHHYILKGDVDIATLDATQNPWLKGHADWQIPIEFNDDSSFSGETKVDVTFQGTRVDPSMSCSDTDTVKGMTWKANGKIDRSEMQVTFTMIFPPSEITMVCTTASGTNTTQVLGAGNEWRAEFSEAVSVGDPIPLNLRPQSKEGFYGLLQGEFTILEEEKK
jgi:hypothetical protein